MSVTKIKTFTRNVLPAPETKSRKKGRKASGKAPLKTLKVPPKKMSIGGTRSFSRFLLFLQCIFIFLKPFSGNRK